MSNGIIKIRDRYFEWSTVTDSPATVGLTRSELRDYISTTYGSKGLEDLARQMARIEEVGTNYPGVTLKDVISDNRAGEGEKRLTAEQIYMRYQKGKESHFPPPSDDAKENLLREYKAARNIMSRLGNATALAQKAPVYDGKEELLRSLIDVRRLTEKLSDALKKDVESYGLGK